MQAIIMAGGSGSRLRPLTNDIPKPMVPIIDRPVLELIIRHLKKHNITDIAMTLGYKADIIKSAYGDGSKFGVNIRYYVEDKPLGTAGGVKNASDFIKGEFIVISGDAVTDIDIKEMYEFHKDKGALITLACKELEDVTGMGVLKVDEDGKVIEFMEKPEHTEEKLVNTGIYIMEKRALELIPDGFYDFGRNLLPSLQSGLYAYETHNFWSDIGTLASYYMTNHFVASNPNLFGIML
jgi:NDP-sugar pyrophosphorylase family protein